MAEVGEILNRLTDELANVSKVFKLLKGTVKRLNLHVWLNCFITSDAQKQ